MALNSRNPIDPRWVTHNRLVVRGLQFAQVEIYKPNDSSQTYNATTNTWSGEATTIFAGPARVQPINAANSEANTFDPTIIKSIRVQISANADGLLDIRPNYKLRVTSSRYNQTLGNFIYVVTDIMNSSNAWEQTLICKVDTELDPTNA